MSNAARTHLIRIGNSRGVRIPKTLLDQLDLGDEVEMAVRGNGLVIRPARRPREGWEEKFRAMHDAGDDRAVEEFPPSAWDAREWEWR
jgi:antitoxin MazE